MSGHALLFAPDRGTVERKYFRGRSDEVTWQEAAGRAARTDEGVAALERRTFWQRSPGYTGPPRSECGDADPDRISMWRPAALSARTPAFAESARSLDQTTG